MRHLLAFKPIAVHISFDVANLLSFLASASLRIVSHPGPLYGSGWATAVAALQLAARFLDVEVDAHPPPPPPPLPLWVCGGAVGAVRSGSKIGP
jgi:hypothetical protein